MNMPKANELEPNVDGFDPNWEAEFEKAERKGNDDDDEQSGE